DLGLAKRSLHGQHGAVTLRGSGHVEGVVAGAVANHLRVDARSSMASVLQLLEKEGSGALGDDEAVPLLVEGARRLCRIVVLGKGPHRAEPRIDDPNEASLRATGDDRLGIAAADRFERLPDGAAAGGAGGDHRHIRAPQAQRDRDMPRGGVGQHVLDEGRADALEAALLEDALLFEEDPKPARRTAKDNAYLVEQAVA